MEHFEVSFLPDGKSLKIHAGATILEAAQQVGIILNTVCGQKGTCGKCKVILEPQGQVVLACQYKIKDNVTVKIPEESRFFQQQILQHGLKRQIELHPNISKAVIRLQARQELEDIAEAVRQGIEDCVRIDKEKLSTLIKSELPADCAQGRQIITAVYRKTDDGSECNYELAGIEPADTTDSIFGAAVDIGTTTVVAKLVDLRSGEVLGAESETNPQIQFGDDVISRIMYASTEDGSKELQNSIIGCINRLTGKLCQSCGISSQYIYEVVAAGNTAMNHLLAGFPVEQLGQAPYEAYNTDSLTVPASQLDLQISKFGKVYLPPNVAGFIGSDTTAVAVAVGMDTVEKMTLVVDIGTNGEIILGTKDRMVSASCAAGPALEGARISCGSRAVRGAIESVVYDGDDIAVDVIGGGRARTICGSGLIDAIAVMLELGVIDQTGRFAERQELEGKVSEKILTRLIEIAGEKAFVFGAPDAEPAAALSQKDVRQAQLAKAAIRAGIEILMERLGIGADDVEQVLLAGAFGNYIRRESAVRIGLLPKVTVEKIHFVGNAASEGAQMMLLSNQCRKTCQRIAQKMEYIELAQEKRFQDVFAEAIMF